MQLLSLFFLVAAGCATPTPPDPARWAPEGWYRFQCGIVNQNGMARLSHRDGRIRVELLEDAGGTFSLRPRADGRLEIVDAKMDYPGLKRSFKGEGAVTSPGVAAGTAVMWLKSMGPISRNHREGAWTLRPATAEEIADFQRKQKQREARRQRVLDAETEPHTGSHP